MSFKTIDLLLLFLGLFFVVLTQVACTATLGAPDGDDAYNAESVNEAMEEEEEEDAWREINR